MLNWKNKKKQNKKSKEIKNTSDHDDAWGITAYQNKTIPGPTRMLCVNFSPIGSAVFLENRKKRRFSRETGRFS